MKKLLLLLPAVALIASCSKTEVSESSSSEGEDFTPRQFIASIEEDVKTYLKENSVFWYNGDAISVFDETGANFKFVAESAGATTTFTQVTEGDLQGTTFYAVYPYSAQNSISSGSVTIGMKNTYSSKAGSFTLASGCVMTARTTTDKLNFKNLTSLIKFTIPAESGISSLYFFGGGSSSLVGTVTASIADDGTPSITAAPESDGGITITPTEGATFTAGDYYMPVLPGTYTSFRVKIDYAEGTVTTSDAFNLNSLTLSRSKITNIGNIYDGRKWYKWLGFEDGSIPPVIIEHGGTQNIVDNPVVGNANGSAKALQVSVASGGSGYFVIDLSKINSATRGRIKSFKFHYKPNGTKFCPRVRFNNLKAAQFPPFRIGGKEGDYSVGATYASELHSDYWNELEFTAAQYGKTSFADITSIQIRPLVWSSGSDCSEGAVSVFIDNIGFSFE